MLIKQLDLSDINEYESEITDCLQTCLEITFQNGECEIAKDKIESLKTHLERGSAYPFGAFENEVMIGFLWAYPISSPLQEVFHVAYIAVNEASRGRGIGSMLLNAAEKKAQDLGLNYIELIVGAENNGAIMFYSKQGYSMGRHILSKCIKDK